MYVVYKYIRMLHMCAICTLLLYNAVYQCAGNDIVAAGYCAWSKLGPLPHIDTCWSTGVDHIVEKTLTYHIALYCNGIQQSSMGYTCILGVRVCNFLGAV